MKIGIIGTRGIPNNYGGFEQFAQYLSEGLAERGHSVFVYNSSLHPYQETHFGKVNIIHCKDPEDKWGTAGQFFYDRNCLDDAKDRNFEILLHLGYTSDSIWHKRWSKKTIHLVNMDGLEWKRSKYNALTRRFLKWAEKLAARHADELIADSTAIQQHLRDQYGRSSTYIPYGANIFDKPTPGSLDAFHLKANSYGLLIARMEPENNIETIIQRWIGAKQEIPLIIISNADTKYGRRLQKRYKDDRIKFAGTIFDQSLLNNLRYYSAYYFHGHSVGGTNPSLLEAMSCNCRIIAHDNIFNRAVLGGDAQYFSSLNDIISILNRREEEEIISKMKERNKDKIRKNYDWKQVIDLYEELMKKHQTA